MTFEISHIGGEQEINDNALFYGVTNSGRSSLRWILKSMQFQRKKILVPDFICQIVIDELNKYGLEITFYHIEKNLEFDLPSNLAQFDALYLVRYFGHNSISFSGMISHSPIPLIIDDVFGVDAPNVSSKIHWSYFNSLRKISFIIDFSYVVSNQPLSIIKKERLDIFTEKKHSAKLKKFHFITNNIGMESDYLNDFIDAENILNKAKEIYQPSERSIIQSNAFYRNLEKEKMHCLSNANVIKKELGDNKNIELIELNAEYMPFQPILLKNRDKIRKELFKKNVFLAIHWPNINGCSNSLSQKIISIPLDSRYSNKTISILCDMIKNLFD